jgi:hypothetical protein
MFNPRLLLSTPTEERAKLIVELNTNHTVVTKPGFQNRRNRSTYLKKSYPAGFSIKNKLTESLGQSILKDHTSQSRMTNPYGSFTEWTKGEDSEQAPDGVSVDLTDPYADVAGPYLGDILANNSGRPLFDDNIQSDVVATSLPLHTRPVGKDKKNSKTKSVS